MEATVSITPIRNPPMRNRTRASIFRRLQLFVERTKNPLSLAGKTIKKE